MAGHNYYLLAALPGLGDLGAAPPVAPLELLEQVAEVAPAAAELVATLLLSDDLLQRQALLAGETEETDLVVLSAAQARGEAPLPGFLVGGGDEQTDMSGRAAGDVLWASYFRHAAAVADRHRNEFLRQWVAYEVALRNALAAARAKALGLDALNYLVAPELGGDDDFNSLISEWTAAPDPLAGLRVLDTARWAWLVDHEAWFSFQDDEVAAYAAKLMLLVRWQRLGRQTAARRDVAQAS